jgi:2,5-dihydroxypyridine 5,6-dioxygenase
MTRKAKHVKMTTPTGHEVELDINPEWPITSFAGYADVPGAHMFPGQIAWTPAFESVHGTIVFDGSILPDIGILHGPVTLKVKKDRVIEISGGPQASQFENWLRSWDDPRMFRLAHTCYGFNPGAKITGQLGEDERVWGCTQWGLGAIGKMLVPPDGLPAASHIDGMCLNTSTWLDDKQITDKGRVIDNELKPLADRLLGRPDHP